MAQPVLIRSQPLRATAIGKKLINHYYQVAQLEAALLPEILNDAPQKPLTIHLATNADSLATWLIPAIAHTIKTNLIELNMLVADEEHTIEKLKDGEAFGAIGLQPLPIKGCQVSRLGNFNYILVASSEFQNTYFKQGINVQTLRHAPGVAFDQRDNMHVRFVETQYGLKQGDYPLHAIRSSEAFVTLAKYGAAYCLVAELQIQQELQSGELINLLPDYKLVETLYWHHWTLLKGVHKKISDVIIEAGQRVLA
jgi:LysR family transcriptional regulator (chromosome initiation inhibitor)